MTEDPFAVVARLGLNRAMSNKPKKPKGITIGKDPPADPKDHEIWLQPLDDFEPALMWMYYKGQWVRITGGTSQ